MDPRSLLGEFSEERSGRASTPPTSTGIHEVGDAGASLVEILVIYRQTPHLLAGLRQRFGEALIKGIIIGEDSCVVVAESNYDGACQSRSINQMRAAKLACIAK